MFSHFKKSWSDLPKLSTFPTTPPACLNASGRNLEFNLNLLMSKIDSIKFKLPPKLHILLWNLHANRYYHLLLQIRCVHKYRWCWASAKMRLFYPNWVTQFVTIRFLETKVELKIRLFSVKRDPPCEQNCVIFIWARDRIPSYNLLRSTIYTKTYLTGKNLPEGSIAHNLTAPS